MTVSSPLDSVRAQYEALPYPSRDPRDEAIRLIREQGAAQPFFLNLCHYAVHMPMQADPALTAKYQAKARRLGLDQLPTFAEGEFFTTEHQQGQRVVRRLRQSEPAYAAMLENLDWLVDTDIDLLENLELFLNNS